MDQPRVELIGKSLFVHFPEEILPSVVEKTKELIDSSLSDSEYQNVVLNLAALDGINSLGIGMLVAINTKCVGLRKKMYLLKPNSNIFKILKLVKLENFFRILNNAEELPE